VFIRWRKLSGIEHYPRFEKPLPGCFLRGNYYCYPLWSTSNANTIPCLCIVSSRSNSSFASYISDTTCPPRTMTRSTENDVIMCGDVISIVTCYCAGRTPRFWLIDYLMTLYVDVIEVHGCLNDTK
jgi:hypothetical protein